MADAVPGTALDLKSVTVADETLTLGSDVEASQANLQKFVDAYNAVLSLVQKQTAVTEGTNRSTTLAGDMAVKNLQSRLQQFTVTQVNPAGTVRTLADLGIKTARDGSLSIDAATFASALSRDPGSVDALFTRASTGLADSVELLVKQQTDGTDGILQTRKTSLGDLVKRMDDDAAKLQLRVDAYRDNLVREFAAMESIISGLNATSNFLAQQSSLGSSSSGGNSK